MLCQIRPELYHVLSLRNGIKDICVEQPELSCALYRYFSPSMYMKTDKCGNNEQ
jgi:hypothetical protein